MEATSQSPTENGAGGLRFVEPRPDPFVNFMLYGPPGSGKTVGACGVPGPVLVLNAERPNATRYAHLLYGDSLREARIEGVRTLVAATEAIRTGDFQSVVVDPLGALHRTLLMEVSGGAFSPTLPQYGDASTHMERFCLWLFEAPVHVVLVAHEHAHKTKEGNEKLPWTGTTNPAIAENLMAEADVVGYTGVAETEAAEPMYMATLVNTEDRRGKDRFGAIGPARELNLGEWVELARKAQPAATEARKKEGAAK